MDVRCEKCLTEYEFDDARVTEAGVTVKCTTCGHVFKVKKPGAAALPPLPHADEFAPEASQIDRVREWKIRQPNGNIFTCRELTTLQKWIVERKVSRDDEISLSGDAWKRLGDIPELAGFFLVVDQANKAQLLEQQMRTGPSGGHAPTLMSAPAAPQQRPTTGGYQLGSPPPRAQHEPTWLQPPPDESYEDDLKAIKKRGPGIWLGLLVVLLAGGGGAYFYLHSQGMFGGVARQQASGTTGTAALPDKGPTTATSTPTQVAPPTPPTPAVAGAVDSGPAIVDAGAPIVDAGHEPLDAGHAVPDAGPAFVDAGAPVKTSGGTTGAAVAVARPSTGGAAPHPKSFEGLMAEGARFEQRGRAQASLNAYQQAIELEPGSAEAWSGKAQALVDLENYPGAEDAYRRALTIAPRFSDAEFGLAEALKFQGKKPEAIKQYKKFIADHPDDTENVGIARRAIGELSD